jgi:hypothetical protein
VLQIADFLTFPEGFGLAHDDLHWPSFIAAANDCDRLVPTLAGGTRRFSECFCAWTAAEQRRDVLTRMLAACDADLWEDEDGKINIWVGKYEEPTVTLTDEHFSSMRVERLNSVYSDANVAVAKYIEPRMSYAQNTAPEYREEESIALVGERISDVTFECVPNFEQAYALTARGVRRANTPKKITASGPLRMLIADGERYVRIESTLFGQSGVFRVMKLAIVGGSRVDGVFHLVTPQMFEDVIPPYDAINPDMPAIDDVNPYTPPTPDAPTLSSSLVDGGAQILGVAHFDGGHPAPDGDSSSQTRFQYRAVDPVTSDPLGDGEWVAWADYLDLYSGHSPVIPGVNGEAQRYEVQCWLVSLAGKPGDFSPSAFIAISTFT